MRAWLDALAASSLEPRSVAILFPYVAVALTVAITALSWRRLKQRLGDGPGMRWYFVSVFVLFVAVPVGLLVALERDPLAALAALGVRAGNVRVGLLVVAAGVPLAWVLGEIASRDPAMREQYPFSKDACASDGAFVRYELGYLLLYYPAWEFLYRGLLFFPLAASVGFPAAAAVTTALSTLHHLGHPDSEIVGALVGGVLFSLVCQATGSVFYAMALHALIGIADDVLIYARGHRRQSR